MELIIGGAAQGKLAYAERYLTCEKNHNKNDNSEEHRKDATWILDGATCDCEALEEKPIMIWNHLHAYIRRMLTASREDEIRPQIQKVLRKNPDMIVITNEIGYGIVPMDAFERNYRELTGRICCELAAQATHVTRVVCGIGTVIK